MLLIDVVSDIPSNTLGTFANLAQYGALGAIAVFMGTALWLLLKRMLKAEDELKTKVDELQKEMNNYIINDQNKLKEVIENNSKVMSSLRDIVLEIKIREQNRR